MFILFVLISCGDSEKKTNKTEVILVDTSKTSSMYREEKVKVKTSTLLILKQKSFVIFLK